MALRTPMARTTGHTETSLRDGHRVRSAISSQWKSPMEACLLSSLAHPVALLHQSRRTREKALECSDCGKAGPHLLCSTRRLLLLKSLLSVRSAGKLLGEPHTSFSIREHTRVRSPMTVGSVGKPLVVLPTSPSIRGFTLGSNPMNAKNVEGRL